MAVIRPFRGLRFSEAAGPLTSLVAPPYDVLTPAERDALAAQSPHNIVHLTLPEGKEDDRSKYVKYARSAAGLAAWRREGVLELEEAPALYRYRQTFALPGVGEAFTRTAVVALIKVEPYDRGVVLPHEQTFPKHKEDRMRILEATRAHLECIFGLFEDPDGAIHQALEQAPSVGSAEVEADGIHHVFEPIVDSEAVAGLVRQLADKKVWIADGHHRYETAVAYRERQGDSEVEIPEDYMMMALASMSDPGLALLPTHRVVAHLDMERGAALARLAEAFVVEEVPNAAIPERLAGASAQGVRAFGVAFPGGHGAMLTPKDEEAVVAMNDMEGSRELRSLDVTLLHQVILGRLLGVRGLESISYTRDAAEAVEAPDLGRGVAFLMNPPTVDDMRRIALGGEKMPQKSTFYYPKLASGLVVWSLNDFS